MRELKLSLADVLILYLVRFPASTTRQRPVEKTTAYMTSGFGIASAVPLLYTPLDDFVNNRPFFDLLFALMDTHFLTTNEPPSTSESGVFLAAISR